MREPRAVFRCGALCLVAALASGPSWACSVPVFRWALERWPADPYELMVFHSEPLSEAAQARLDALEEAAQNAEHPANVVVRRLDPEQDLGAYEKVVWESRAEQDGLPWAALAYPRTGRIPKPAWTGAPEALPVAALLDSPARRTSAERILDGQTAVWVLLECGDKAQDDAAAKRLEDVLAEAQKVLRLPDMTDDPVLDSADAPDVSDLRIEFSVLRVPAGAEDEPFLRTMLLGIEPDLAGLADKPMAFPIYGRGRALYAFVGEGINEDTLFSACAFLTGRCSCEVKAQNPGVDLLMAVDWEGGLGGVELVKEIVLPPLPGVESGVEDKAAAVAHEAAPEQAPTCCTASAQAAQAAAKETADTAHTMKAVLWSLGGVAAAVAALSAVLAYRGGRHGETDGA